MKSRTPETIYVARPINHVGQESYFVSEEAARAFALDCLDRWSIHYEIGAVQLDALIRSKRNQIAALHVVLHRLCDVIDEIQQDHIIEMDPEIDWILQDSRRAIENAAMANALQFDLLPGAAPAVDRSGAPNENSNRQRTQAA